MIALALLLAAAVPSQAQDKRADDTYYLKGGGGLSDYAGDRGPTSDLADFFDTEKFSADDAFPYTLLGEVGYQFSPATSLGLGYQFGQYPYADGPATSSAIGTARHTVQLLGRYTFGARNWTVAPYLDAGANVSFGGESTAVGPSLGAGLDVVVSSRTSLFFEARFNGTFDDGATDNRPRNGSAGVPFDGLSALPAAGVKVNFESATTAPRVLALDGPTEAEAGEDVTFTATVNEEEATRPLSYEWDFGDGGSDTGTTASRAFREPGSYTITFTASNEAGEASDSMTINVAQAPQPAQIASLNADPNPVDEGETVRFSANVEGDSPLSYDWSFGDGSSASSESPTHTYDEPGEYTVRLNASNDEGEDSRSVTVEVERDLPEVCMSVSEMNAAFFDRNSSTLTDEAEEELEENAEILSDCPNVSVRIEGFAAPGERDAQSLSEDRADAVAEFYEDNGVPSDRIMTSGEGQVEDVTSKKDGTQEYRRADSIPEREDDDM
ncbi:MAG: PKD domain-containing protein [Salinivenus sp.]